MTVCSLSSMRALRLTSITLVSVFGLETVLAGSALAQKAPLQPPPPASAPEPPNNAEEAAELKKEGNEALGALRPGDALEAYRRAYALAPDAALHYNMGHALEALGNYPDALTEYEEFARVAPDEMKARVPKLAELISEVRARVTVVTLRCNVPGARVLVRDVAVGTVGPDGMFTHGFPAGPATLEVTAEGYATHRQHATLERGGQVTFDVELVTKATAGLLRITTTPFLGDVYVDDKAIGRAPAEASVVAGTHSIVVRASGVREAKTQTVVAVGETREITVDLEQTPPVYTQWWFWSGVAVVVAGGAVITYAALKSRSPDTGSLGVTSVQSHHVTTLFGF